MGKKLKGKRLAAARRNIKKAQAARRRNKRSKPRRRKSSRSTTRRRPTKRRSSPRKKTNKRRSTSKSMVGKIPFINNPTVRKIATGIGTATLAVTVLGFVAPQIAANPIIRPAIAFLAGGPISAGVQFLTQGGIGQATGGNGGGGNA